MEEFTKLVSLMESLRGPQGCARTPIRLGLAKAGKSLLEKQRGAMEKAASLISEIVWKNSRSS